MGVVVFETDALCRFENEEVFFKDALNLEFKANDILKGSSEEIIMYSNTYKINQANRRDSREFVFTLRYNFNSAKSKYKGTGAGEAQKSRM